MAQDFFLRVDVILTAVFIILAFAFFKSIAPMVIFLTLAVMFSRATSLYDNMKIEFHSALIIAAVLILGPKVGIFMAVVSALYQNKLGKVLGSFQKPPWILLDTVYLVLLSVLVPFLPPGNLIFYSFLIILILGNIVLGAIRVMFFQDPLVRRAMLATINLIFNYIILTRFLEKMVAFIRA